MEEIKKTLAEGRSRLRKPLPLNLALESGKLPPQAIDLEEAVLGALMLEKEALNDVIDILSPQSFYKEEHQKIFSAIIELFQLGKPIDLLTVTETLKSRGELDFVGGPFYISQLTNRVASSAHAEYHARIISQKHILRELIRISSETIRDAYDETTDVFELLDKSEKGLFDVTQGNIRKDYEKMNNLLHDAIEQLEKLGKQKDGLSGVPSGFSELDRVTSGFQKSDLIVVAARPGMGKTAFVLSLARNTAVDHKRPVGIFSLEMSTRQLTFRLIASETELNAAKLRTGKLENHEWEQLNAKIGKLAEAAIFIDDTPALSVFELRAKCRRMKAKHNIELIIVDYLQLMTVGGDNKNSRNGNREQEISMISRSLKGIAKELDVPVIALSQLSRAVETRGGTSSVKRPQLSDLRESGAIEQDADVVAFIYRPEYYGLTQDAEGNSTIGLAELIIAKHRNGALRDVKMKFIEELAKFTDWETSDIFHTSDESEGIPQSNIIRRSRMDEMDDDKDAGMPF